MERGHFILNRRGIDILTSSCDHVLFSPFDDIVAILSERHQIARTEEAMFIKRLFIFLVVPKVAFKSQCAPANHLPDLPRLGVSSFIVHEPDFDIGVNDQWFTNSVHLRFFGSGPSGTEMDSLRRAEYVDEINSQLVQNPPNEFRSHLFCSTPYDLE